MSGLAPVNENATWSADAEAHSCYMLQNGITHDEIPGYAGLHAGRRHRRQQRQRRGVSSSINATARNHIDLWMTGPFHAIGILRHNLATSGFGLCATRRTHRRRGAPAARSTSIRGIDTARPRPATPILFPGDGATVPLNRFVTEFPNPLTMCGWTGNAGLPLIAMMPNKVTNGDRDAHRPERPGRDLHPAQGQHRVRRHRQGDPRRRQRGGRDAPRHPRRRHLHARRVNSNGGSGTWSLHRRTTRRSGRCGATPSPSRPTRSRPPDGRSTSSRSIRSASSTARKGHGAAPSAGQTVRIKVAGRDVIALSANFVAVRPRRDRLHHGLQLHGEIARREHAQLQRPADSSPTRRSCRSSSGEMCLFSLVDVDVVIDVNGFYRTSARTAEFNPITPAASARHAQRRAQRLQGRRGTRGSASTGAVRRVRRSGVDAVSLNVTAIQGAGRRIPAGLPVRMPSERRDLAP